MESWVQRVVAKWATEGVKINDKTSMDSIELTEVILDFKFPEDFKELYLEMNGFKGHDWQEHMFYFWPLERIIEEFNESLDKNFVGFCDFLIASHYIGFRRDKAGIFKMYGANAENDSISQTFEEVVAMINSNSDLIY